MRQFPHCGPTNIMRHHAKFGHPGQPGAHDLCIPLVYSVNARCKCHLHKPASNVFCFQKSTHHDGIRVNSSPHGLTNMKNGKT